MEKNSAFGRVAPDHFKVHPCTPILAAIYLDGLPTPITGLKTCATACLSPVLVPIAPPHQQVKACGGATGACTCPREQACQWSLCIVLATVYWCWARQQVVPVRERRKELRQRSCATSDALPKLLFAAPGAACTHSLALRPEQLYLVKALCAACPTSSPQQQTWLSWHTSEPSGETWPDTDFFPIHGIDIIWFEVSIQANSSLEGSPKWAKQKGTIFECHNLEKS